MKFLRAFLKTLSNSENCFESRIKFLFRLFFTLTGHFFLVYIHSRLSEQFQDQRLITEQLLGTQAAMEQVP